MTIPKSTEARLYAKGLLSVKPAQALEILARDTTYLSDGLAYIETERTSYRNSGGYACYETSIRFIVSGKLEREYKIGNRPAPASWSSEKGAELRFFIHRVYDRLHDIAREQEEAETARINAQLSALPVNDAEAIARFSKI